ncbi:hypothetical protein [Streptomyces sp. HPF1205]|uniref:hypothetical protein n=1 Tax=Streptomyces sp. HPF1205 TaxID=2873262 RepID=UPI001CECD938|nr:hypothetical protein [Streptomyces sp. HPF1205]
MFDNAAAGGKLSRHGRTAAVAACVGAALIAVGAGARSAAASADPHTASRPAAVRAAAVAAPGLGSGSLVQSEDFFQQGLAPVGATVDLTGKQALSACTGEETMRALTAAKAAAYADVTWTFDTKGALLTESAADGSTDAAAVSYEKRLGGLVRGCQDEPAGHWYYGAGHAFTTQAGEGTWYPAFNGDGKAAGGVAVIRGGHRFGIVELSGRPSDDPSYIAGIAAAALNRLAD